jgi:hypothetical protein
MAVAILLLATAGACSSSKGPDLSQDSAVFGGLPHDVVVQSLADPSLQEALKASEPSVRVQMAQLNISSTIFCRDALRAYQAWTTLGVAPAVPTVVKPLTPAAGFDAFMNEWVDSVQQTISSGDPDNLRTWLLAGGAGCHDTVADPATSTTRTVADVLQGS